MLKFSSFRDNVIAGLLVLFGLSGDADVQVIDNAAMVIRRAENATMVDVRGDEVGKGIGNWERA